MTRFKTISSTSALIAALSMAVTPLSAAELPEFAPAMAKQNSIPVAQNWEPGDEIAEHHRRYRHRRHRGVDAGDVLAGVLIIGGIAAIASAGSNKRDRNRTINQPRYNERTSDANRSIDSAVSTCLRQIERDVRVESVNTVNRTGNGWDVAGTLYNGDGFTCQIDNNGRVNGISYGAGSTPVSYDQATDRQYSDDRYSAAWDRVEGRNGQAQTQAQAPAQAQAPTQPTGPQPAYPGGPLPGEEVYEDERLGG